MDTREIITNHLRNYVPDPRNNETVSKNRVQVYREEYKTYTGEAIEISTNEGYGFYSILGLEDEDGHFYRFGTDYWVITERDKIYIQFMDYEESKKPEEGKELLIKFREVKEGRQWINPAKQSRVIKEQDYPIVSVSIISEAGGRLGDFQAPISRQTQYQVEVRTKEDNLFAYTEAGSNLERTMGGEQLSTEIIEHTIRAIADHEEDLHPTLYGFVLNEGGTYIEFEENTQSHRRVTSFSLWRIT